MACRTTRQRVSSQSCEAAHCLLSDSDSSLTPCEVRSQKRCDVDDRCPAKVDLMSCNSSFSDCSLPCHQLVTCSCDCEPLAQGRVKVCNVGKPRRSCPGSACLDTDLASRQTKYSGQASRRHARLARRVGPRADFFVV